MNPPADDAAYFPDGSPSYETLLTDAHPIIAAFGGMFLLMLFLNWLFEEKEHTWLTWLERPLAQGRLARFHGHPGRLPDPADHLRRPWPKTPRRSCSLVSPAW